MLDTTIRIGREVADRIDRVCESRGLSRACLVSALVRRVSRRLRPLPEERVRVKYQCRRAKSEWRCVHLALRPDEYEFFGDTRKVFRLSVSCIVAYAVEHLLDELLEEMADDVDNYRYRNYLIARFMAGDVVCWIHCWGIPPQIALGEPIIPTLGTH